MKNNIKCMCVCHMAILERLVDGCLISFDLLEIVKYTFEEVWGDEFEVWKLNIS